MRRRSSIAVVLASLGLAGCSAVAAEREAAVPARAGGGGGGGLSVVTEPRPDSVGPLIAMIAGARHTVTLTIYELNDGRVEHTLVSAARRGVRVRVLLNGGYHGHREGTNRAAYGYLRQHGVAVRYTPVRFALTHQKTLSVDGLRAAIMTLNFTPRYYAFDRDYAVIDSDRTDVAAIERVFDADWHGAAVTPGAGARGLVFSPGATEAFTELIASARRSLDLESEELSDPPVLDALCAAATRGVDVRLVMTYSPDWTSGFRRLLGCGVHVRMFEGEHPIYVHAKLIVADHRTVLIGSQNLTAASLERNRELSIRSSDPRVVDAVSGTFDGDFARAKPASRRATL